MRSAAATVYSEPATRMVSAAPAVERASARASAGSAATRVAARPRAADRSPAGSAPRAVGGWVRMISSASGARHPSIASQFLSLRTPKTRISRPSSARCSARNVARTCAPAGLCAPSRMIRGSTLDDLQAARPLGRRQAATDGGFVRPEPAIPGCLDRGDGEHGVVDLMTTDQRDPQSLIASPGAVKIEDLSRQARFPHPPAIGIRNGDNGSVEGRGRPPDHFQRLASRSGDDGHLGFDDPRLLAGDLRHRPPEILLMLQGNVGDHRHLGPDHVGRVESAAQPHLDHGDVRHPAPKMQERHGGREFKERRMRQAVARRRRGLRREMGRAERLQPLRQRDDLLLSDPLPVHLNPLGEAEQVGRRVQAGPVPRSPEDRGRHGGGGSLAVGPADVDGRHSRMRVAQERPGGAGWSPGPDAIRIVGDHTETRLPRRRSRSPPNRLPRKAHLRRCRTRAALRRTC